MKGKANDCNIKAAARSNFLKQKYVLGSISQKVVRKPSICLSYKFALIPFNVLNIQQASAMQKDLFELARLRKKDAFMEIDSISLQEIYSLNTGKILKIFIVLNN